MQKLLQLYNKLPKYLIAAIIVIVPLFPKFPLINIPGTYVAIRFEDVLLLALGVLTLIKVIPNIKTLLTDKIIIALLIYFGIGLVSLLSGVYLTHTVGMSVGIFHLVRRIEYIVPFIAVLVLFKKVDFRRELDFYIKLLMIVTILTFVYGLGQRYLSFPIIITQNSEYSKGIALRWTPGSHINSTFAGHYDLAAFMVILLPIFITMAFTIKGMFSRLFTLLSVGGGLWLLINSVSRISQVSYLLAVSIAFLLIKKYKALGFVLLASLILIVTSSGLQARFGRLFEVIYEKVNISKTLTHIQSSFTVLADEITIPGKKIDAPVATPTPIPVFEDRSTSIRLKVEWPRALRAFYKNPLLGTGYSSISLATDNDYLRLLGETGILGFLAFWFVFFRIGQVIIKLIPLGSELTVLEQSFLAGMFGGIIGTFLSASLIDLFEASKFATMFWLLLGMMVLLARKDEYEQKH